MPPDAGETGAVPVLLAAMSYLDRGWTVVPVEFRGKRPLNPNDTHGRKWQALRGKAGDVDRWFNGVQRNVGIILGAASGGLIDIDVDAREALVLAPRFLPKTEVIFGRLSKPQSHWLYVASVRSRQFKDPVRGDMLVEQRSDGMQTVFPPSLHASGESVEWASSGEPLVMAGDQLERSVGELAAAALLARCWPGEGGRHDAGLTLTAFLKRAGWGDQRIAHFVAAVVSTAGGDADHAKRLATARDTGARLDNSRPVRGFPALASLFGESVARNVADWLGVGSDVGPANKHDGRCGLTHGSHVAQAGAALAVLRGEHSETIFCGNQFWSYNGKIWRVVSDTDIRRAVYALDAAPVAGRGRPVTLTKTGIDGVIHEMSVLAAAEDFFAGAAHGFNCENGFVSFGEGFAPTVTPHDPSHRKRHVVPGAWRADAPARPPPDSLFARFLRGSFGEGQDAEEAIDLLAEVAGVAALGAGVDLKEPVAVILYGPSAGNGKSQLLHLLRGLVSPSASASLSPDLFPDEKHLVQLAGRTLNACDELGGGAIFSEPFKRIVSGEPIVARDVYKSAFSFRPNAQHVFATNVLPSFRRGVDRGLQRRLLIVPMIRVIPDAEQIARIAQCILDEEMHLLVAWAIAGAARALARKDLARPRSSIEAKRAWLAEGDVVLSWLFDEAEVAFVADAWLSSRDAYAAFRSWATKGGFAEIPNINVFAARVYNAGIKNLVRQRTAKAAGIRGLSLVRALRRDQG